MDAIKIEKYKLIANVIDSFTECYGDIPLYGSKDGHVESAVLLAWLMNNPHMAEIAAKIHKLDKA